MTKEARERIAIWLGWDRNSPDELCYWHYKKQAESLLELIITLGYRLPPKLELIGIKELQAEFQRRGYQYHYITPTHRIMLEAQLAADQKAIEGVN